jgi:hypothetical protein
MSEQWAALARLIAAQSENNLLGFSIFGLTLTPQALVRVAYLLVAVGYFMVNFQAAHKLGAGEA